MLADQRFRVEDRLTIQEELASNSYVSKQRILSNAYRDYLREGLDLEEFQEVVASCGIDYGARTCEMLLSNSCGGRSIFGARFLHGLVKTFR